MYIVAVEVIWPLARMAIVALTTAQRSMLFFVCLLATVGATNCPINSTVTRDTKPLYLLTLVPFPQSEDYGWSNGLGTVSGARVARDEINDRNDILPGHHLELLVENIEACSLTEATIGTVNLIKYTVDSPCLPVVGILGLLCSTHTSLISPLAGHEGIDLIQMSIANSPIFETSKFSSFPHLWRVLGSGAVYADAAVNLMDELGWKRVAVIYDHNSAYYSHVALHFRKVVHNRNDTQIIFFDAVLGKNTLQLRQIVSSIKNQAATVLFVALSDYQSANLLCLLNKEKLHYPSYIWLQVGSRVNRILAAGKSLGLCANEDILSAKEGHIDMQIRRAQSNHSKILISGENYTHYIEKYMADFEEVNKTYSSHKIDRDLTFSNLMYDEVWALALAINNSLPVLESKNLSIDSYAIGHKEITTLIEEQLANVKFQGASGLIEFNQKRSVIATVDIFQIFNSSEVFVGSYVPVVDSNHMVIAYNLSIDIDKNKIPNGQPDLRNILLPLPVTIILYIATVAMIVFTTVVFILLIYYREWPEVKANSPFLCVIMLIGCYLLIFGIIFRTTYTHFWSIWLNDNHVYSALVTMDSFCSSTGLILLVITVFFKLLRVHHFFSYMTLKLRQLWRTCSMMLLILVLSLWIGFGFIAITIGIRIQPQLRNDSVIEGNKLVIYQYLEYPGMVKRYLDLVTTLYVAIFVILIVYLAIRTRKIEQKQFKDTKKSNVFVTLLIVSVVSQVAISEILREENLSWISILLTSLISLFIPLSVFIVLLLPKLIPSMRKPKPRRRPSRQLSRRRSSGISVKNALYNMSF